MKDLSIISSQRNSEATLSVILLTPLFSHLKRLCLGNRQATETPDDIYIHKKRVVQDLVRYPFPPVSSVVFLNLSKIST